MKRIISLGAAVSVAAALTAVAVAGDNTSGFRTPQASMLTTGDRADVKFTPIATVGEILPGKIRFESIPDGIALRTRGQGRVDVYVNHETSTVPFPYNPAAPTEANSQNDFLNAEVSLLALNQHSAGVLKAEKAISSEEGFQRFCSSFLAWTEQGFDRALLLTNEEAVDWVNRSGKAWPATIGSPAARQAGAVVAHDIKSGDTRPIWGMGRHNHENSVRDPRLRPVGAALGRRHLHEQPVAVAALLVPRRRLGRSLERRGLPVGFRLGRSRRSSATRTSSREAQTRCRVTSSRCRE